ncbi:hypothetical protein V8D89_001771 [Ganoderma adspersum]
METTSPDSGHPNSPAGRYVILFPPDDMTAVERRVADVLRYGIYLEEDSPPGIYLVEEGGEERLVVKHRGPQAGYCGAGGGEFGLVTAVESSTSVTSETTTADPDPSAIPFQASKATKVSESELIIRVEDDPPEVVGSYVSMTFTDKMISGMRDYVKNKGALYRLQITIYFQNGHKASFNLQADTGANNAWLFHRRACLLKDIEDNWDAKDGKACKVTLIAGIERPLARAALPPSYMPSYLAKNIKEGTDAGSEVPIPSHFHYPRIMYNAGKAKIVVGPMRSPIDFEIENVHNWLTSGPDHKENLNARFSFAICDAATRSILKDLRIDGLIGFGPEFNMTAFTPRFRHEQDYGNRDYPSFSTALQAFLPNVTGEGGIVLYWYLNPPDVFEGFSFLAFNEFPEHLLSRKISWTAPILIDSLPRSRFRAWIITIKKLTIHLVAGNEYKARGGYGDRDLLIDFGEDGEPFCIDTGCCTTVVTPEASTILESVFDEGQPYSIPEWVDLKNTTVEFTFASPGRSTSDIVFATPAHRFLCDKYRNGLIWSASRHQSESVVRCILGLLLPCIVPALRLENRISDSDPWFHALRLLRLSNIVSDNL